jgi:O-antigen ligase
MDPVVGPVGFANHIFLSLALTNGLIWILYDLKYRTVLTPAMNILLGAAFFGQLIFIGGRTGQVVFFLLFPFALLAILPSRLKGLKILAIVGLCFLFLISSPLVRTRFTRGLDDFKAYSQGDTTTSLGLRLVFWEGAFKMTWQSPMFGVGTGDYGIEMIELQKRGAIPQTPGLSQFDNPHNSYLAYLTGLGIVGLGVLLWFLFTVSKEALLDWQSPEGWFKLSFMGIFILGSFMDSLIWGHDHAFALAIISAIPVSLSTQSEKRTKDAASSGVRE